MRQFYWQLNEVMPRLCWFSAIELFVFIKTVQAACVKFLIYAVWTEIFICVNWDTNLHPCCTLIGWFIVVSQDLLLKELRVFEWPESTSFWGTAELVKPMPPAFPLVSVWMDGESSRGVCCGWAPDRLARELGTTGTSAQVQQMEWQRHVPGLPSCLQGKETPTKNLYKINANKKQK